VSRFTLNPAKRGALPLFIGLCGPSGGGKTYSALRLATGIQRVTGGKLAVIDTEANRALHYAEVFEFDHMPFAPPFSPDDYREALQACIAEGAKTVVIDSLSHEHEGPGGVIEWHAAEVARLAKAWSQPESSVQFPAWAEPKSARRRLLQAILQLDVNLICCFRAKQKIRMPTADERRNGQRQPIDMGWMPIAGVEYAYEMTALGVLPPGARGVPDWDIKDPGTEMVIKRPAQFEKILTRGEPLSEAMGEGMARWAQGNAAAVAASSLGARATELLRLVKMAASLGMLRAVIEQINQERSTLNQAEFGALRAACESRRAKLPPEVE
jgi:hypothetical protein